MVFSGPPNLSYTDEADPAIFDHRESMRKATQPMRKWLIILVLIIVAVLGALWWLGSSLDAHKPEPGETRMEIEHVL